jgi:DNA-directed RNA polymerase subunit omega
MARVTVEDCLENVSNRFLLVHVATQRAKELFKGSYPLITCKNREVVTALREIAAGHVEFQAADSRSESTPSTSAPSEDSS